MNSIKYKSMIFLSAITLLVMVVIMTASYQLVTNYYDEAFEKQAVEADNTLSVVLQEPIFAYDSELAGDILTSFVAFPYIHAIKAYDHRDKLIAEATESSAKPADSQLVSHSKEVVWGGSKVVGKIEVTYRLDSNDGALSAARTMFMLIAVLVLLALGVTNWFILGRYVVKPIEIVADAMSEIAQGGGDLTQRLDIKSDDEVGRLAKSFDTFLSNLHGLVQRIVNSADELAVCASEIKGGAGKNAAATQDQLKEIEQVATALNEMSSTTQEVSNNANTTADKTHSCNELADKGHGIVKKTVDEIYVLGDDLMGTSKKISELRDRSEHINTVLVVIKEIAEQTNLLALNAAIEAARAGEHGRGFAVVADEVRGLAQRTQDSTQEIEGIIKDLQTSSEEANQLMSATSETLANTIEESADAIDALEDIIRDVNEINDMNTHIATATEEQNVVTAEVSEKVEINKHPNF
ncbi:methyl-accepting chemotaxis protein [Vibrio hannami]|uniref:methyl-accepting chemotaxis protein n=1 Tax=Vibrio hannami TaxID=2717094 RepID=UPI00240F5FB4|nr:methyl-accepting chemotaxis protein [Vibrio hannami]MDG3086021.1 methyl-accepting chemotaxis protein [Vibrio hannami]